METTHSGTAVYLVGHGPFHKPRLIELQHRRIMRYYDALGPRSGAKPDIYTDLNLPRTSDGPHKPEALPAFMQLWQAIRAKPYTLVLIDLEDGVNQGSLLFVQPILEEAGARVLNAFYDDDEVVERSLKERFGKRALIDDLTDGADLVGFFPGLAGEVTEAALRRELGRESLPQINDRIDALKRLKPYTGGKVPFVEDRLSLEWKAPERTGG
jgi:hypothetical protein